MVLGARTAMWGGKKLPYKKRLEYIESSGTQYIDTGFSPSSSTEINAILAALSGQEAFIFGGRDSTSGSAQHRFAFYYNSADSRGHGNPQFGNENYPSVVLGMSDLSFHDVTMNSTGLYEDGSLVKTFESSSEFSTSSHLALFGCFTGTSVSRGKGRIKEFEIINDGVLIHSFIPVLDNNDVACMYDEVTGEFFYNQGTGAFTAGPEV